MFVILLTICNITKRDKTVKVLRGKTWQTASLFFKIINLFK